MKSVEKVGKTIDEALNKALSELNLSKDKVDVSIIDEPSKGFFNLFGGKPAKIKVTVKENILDDAKELLRQVLDNMSLDADIDIEESSNGINIDISGSNMGTIIGYRGETLDSLQYLVSLVINKNHQLPYRRVTLDTENYRKKREETLKRVADKTAYKVRKNKRSFKLEPMNPYERRIIHSALQMYDDIRTYSEGEEPYRRIIVDIK
ncbi:RNA-binding cell elongation regulator Jag/EloR [Clostridium vincentii]|uniref:RNA-binding protein KhpB n=1 Tax=Clostridium vincentii TaxID=52704 RepID=A0A2T0BC34_9CLOT|nr:RNA-binding cell elongation regulator Jag/EloR [Clostridium vincentii]PRR81393.1 R3H domain protein [Clostridium vincentii]